MNKTQRRRADIAFACYLSPAACFLYSLLLWGVHGLSDDATVFPGVLLLVPLAVAALCATLAGFYHSLKLRGVWSTYPGLAIVPLALLPFPVLVIRENEPGFETLSGCLAGAYTLISFFFCLRWFLKQRGCALQEASQSPAAWVER